MRVGEICNRHAVIVGKSDSVYRAAELMCDQHVDYIVVIESLGGNNIPVGMVSDHDIVVDMIAKRLDLQAAAVGDVMHAPLLVADEQDLVMTTLKRMRHENERCIPVVTASGALLGILSIDEILDMLSEQLNDIGYIINRKQPNVHADSVDKQQPPDVTSMLHHS